MIKSDFGEKELVAFLTLPKEKLIVAKKQHWIIVAASVAKTFSLSVLFIGFVVYVFGFLLPSPHLLVSSFLLIVTITISIVLKQVIDWYYHFYIITNRKIMEVTIAPFFSDIINDVILEQVRTTEVDVKVRGIINELLNIGEVVVTFDRPSHEEVFSLKNIPNPREIGTFLGDEFESMMDPLAVRFHRGKTSNYLKFTEDIFPHHISPGE